METDLIRTCELIVGLPDVTVLGVEDVGADQPLRLHIESRGRRPVCEECGAAAEVKDRPRVELADLPASWPTGKLSSRRTPTGWVR